jgi:hypothetical protein
MTRKVDYGFDRRIWSRASNLAETLQKTDRILTGMGKIVVKVDTKSEATYSQNESHIQNVNIGVEKLDLFHTDDLLAIMGLNYHEVAHLLFTPKLSYADMYPQRSDGTSIYVQPTLNFLEEGRIETLFGASYPRAKHFFTIAVTRTLLKKLETVQGIDRYPSSATQGFTREQYHGLWVHLLTYGRKYLPANLRSAIRNYAEARFTDANVIADIRKAEKLIDVYRTLCSDEIVGKGVPIAVALAELFPDLFETIAGSSVHQPMNGYGSTSSPKSPKTGEREAQEQARTDAEDGYEEVELEPAESPQDGSGEGSGDEETGEDGSARPGSSGGDSGDQEEEDQDPGTGAGRSTDARMTATEALIEMRKVAEEIGELVESDTNVADDVREIMDALESTSQRSDGSWVSYTRAPSSDEMETSQRMSREFEKLASEVSPGWNYGSDSGRLNVNRAMDPDADPEDIWDEWEEGRETDASVETVVLVDMSGSMSGHRIVDASAFCWVVTRALAEIDANVTVLGFSNTGQVYTLRGRDDPSRPEIVDVYGTVGGTSPAYALNVAKDILNSSQLDNRVLIVMTDGDWQANGYDPASGYENLLNEINAHKTLIGIGMGPRPGISRLFNVVSRCNSVKELTEPILRTIERIARQRVGH